MKIQKKYFQQQVIYYFVPMLYLLVVLNYCSVIILGRQITFTILSTVMSLIAFGIAIPFIGPRMKIIDYLMSAYLLIGVFSGIMYFWSDTPILYLYGLHYNIAPYLIYFPVRFFPQVNFDKLIGNIVKANVITIIYAFLVHIIKPAFHIKYLIISSGDYFADITYSWFRMGGYLGPMLLGNITVVNFVLCLYLYKKTKQEKYWYVAMISGIATFFTMQRSSFIALLIVLVIMLLLYVARVFEALLFNKKHLSISTSKIIGFIRRFAVITFIVGILFFEFGSSIGGFVQNNIFSDTIINRMLSVDSIMNAANERIGQWDLTIDIFEQYPLGMGIGSGGNKAAAYGKSVVTDGNYFRILVETGIVGFVVFVLIIFATLLKLKRPKELRDRTLLLCMAIYLFQAIGTNVFDLYLSSHIFAIVIALSARSEASDQRSG